VPFLVIVIWHPDGGGQQQALRRGMRTLLALEGGLPFIPFLPQICCLISPQIRDHGAQLLIVIWHPVFPPFPIR